MTPLPSKREHGRDGRDATRSSLVRPSHLARRSFLGSVGALGVGALGSTASAAPWPEQDDPYYAELATGLEERGLPPGEFLFGSTEAEAMDAYDASGSLESTSIDAPSHQPFREARRFTVDGSVEDPWGALLKATDADRGLEPGDVLLGVVYLRRAPGTDGPATVQYNAKDADETGTNQVVNAGQPTLDEEWQRYDFQIEAQYASDPGGWWTELFLGYGAQTVDVGGLALIHFGQDASVDQLPDWNPGYEYEGRAEDAAWRQAARGRIDEHRRGPLEVTVTDPEGEPIPDADVHVEMQAHEFGFGSAISVDDLLEDETYQETFLENFNLAVTENGLKAPPWRGEWGASSEQTRAAVDWLHERDVPTRGHALLWATYDFLGVDESQSEASIVSDVQASIEERASAMEGELLEWDMHNHPVMFDEVTQAVGREHVPDWWAAARDADPETPMWANEGSVLSTLNGNRSAYYDYLDWLQSEGVEVDGVGFMGHFSLDYLRPPADLLSVFDQFAEFDAPLKITELDVTVGDTDDPDQVAVRSDYLRDVLIAAYSHEAVEGVLQWGFWAGAHWRPDAALYGADWSLRPHGEVYRDLVFDRWWTDEPGTTGDDGTFEVDAYLGTHEVEATVGEQSATETVVVDDSEAGTSVTVVVDADGGTEPTCTEVDGQQVCDVDGDGLYRDVDGNGEASHADVQAFFSVQHRPAWKQPSLFDFNGNEVVGHGDVVALFEHVATGSL